MGVRRSTQQLTLAGTSGWGGRRAGAGRPRSSGRTNVAHGTRPTHKGRHPVHVTLRAVSRGLPTLRSESVLALLGCVLRAMKRAPYGPFFRVSHFSVQTNHVHLIVEADSEAAAARGVGSVLRSALTGLTSMFARRLNALVQRRGPVWAERYHRHDLCTPREVSNALKYVFHNHAHHGHHEWHGHRTDPWSTAWLFGGWEHPVRRFTAELRERFWPVQEARTWLLRVGAMRGGRFPLLPACSSPNA